MKTAIPKDRWRLRKTNLAVLLSLLSASLLIACTSTKQEPESFRKESVGEFSFELNSNWISDTVSFGIPPQENDCICHVVSFPGQAGIGDTTETREFQYRSDDLSGVRVRLISMTPEFRQKPDLLVADEFKSQLAVSLGISLDQIQPEQVYVESLDSTAILFHQEQSDPFVVDGQEVQQTSWTLVDGQTGVVMSLMCQYRMQFSRDLQRECSTIFENIIGSARQAAPPGA